MTDVEEELTHGADRLRAYVRRRLRDADGADDVVQETFVRVIEQGRRQSIEQPLAYAFRVADSIIHAQARRVGRETGLGDEDFTCPLPLADEVLDYRQRLARFSAALERLTPQRRAVFVKRHVEGKSRQQIADEMGLGIEAVKKHLVRAMVDLSRTTAALSDTAGKGKQNG